jgi:hypothetical protein
VPFALQNHQRVFAVGEQKIEEQKLERVKGHLLSYII